MRVVERDKPGRRVRQLGHRRGRGALVERRVAEAARHRDTRGVNEQPAREVDRPALPAEQRRDGERRSAGRRTHEIAQHRSSADRKGVFAAFGQDPHGAAADETGVPGKLLGQLIGPERPAAFAQHLSGRKNGVGFDTPAAERPGGPLRLVICHDQLGADHLGRAAQGADHGGEREALPGLFELGHPGVKGGHENKCKRHRRLRTK